MATTSARTPSEVSPVWENLKLAIVDSSGFKCWQDGTPESASSELDDEQLVKQLLDTQVRHYLRQTLETLAY